MPLTVDIHEHLVEVPPQLAGPHALDPELSDLRGEHRVETMPPEPDGFVADIDPALVEHDLDIPQKERETNVHQQR